MHSAPTPTRAERHLAALDELLDMAMDFARQLHKDAAAQPEATPHAPENSHRIQTTIAFHHIARAIRRTSLLARKLEEPIPTTPGAQPGAPAAAHPESLEPTPLHPERPGRDAIERLDRLDHLPATSAAAIAAIRQDLRRARTIAPHPATPQPAQDSAAAPHVAAPDSRTPNAAIPRTPAKTPRTHPPPEPPT